MTHDTETTEVWIGDGEAWFPDAPSLCVRLGADYLISSDGDMYAGIRGKGEIPLADLLAGESGNGAQLATVTRIK